MIDVPHDNRDIAYVIIDEFLRKNQILWAIPWQNLKYCDPLPSLV